MVLSMRVGSTPWLRRTSFVLAAMYTLAVARGIPALRHDWSWLPVGGNLAQNLLFKVSGWQEIGMGAPMPNPSRYLLDVLQTVFERILGWHPALIAYALLVGVLVAHASFRLAARIAPHSTPAALGVQVFALFNPWVYTETVAGHLDLIVAYGAIMLLLAECMRSSVRSTRAAIITILLIGQIQLLILSVPILLWLGIRRRVWLPFATVVVLGLPIAVGIIGENAGLAHVPYSLSWQDAQSVDPPKIWLLSGYFARYAAGFSGFATIALGAVACCAAVGAVVALWSRKLSWVAGATVAIAILAMGTKGPLGVPYAWLVTHYKASGVFRELYDLVGLMSIGYICLSCVAAARLRAVGYVVALSALVVASTWWITPPSRFWVDAERLPSLAFDAPPDSRYALFPAYQPLSYLGRGAGTDPDAVLRATRLTPINEYLPTYPSDVALSTYITTGDTRLLGACGVSLIIDRPWYRTVNAGAGLQLKMPERSERQRATMRRIVALPLTTLIGLPRVALLASDLGGGNVFFGDVAGLQGSGVPVRWRTLPHADVIHAPAQTSDPRLGWVDAGLAFVRYPGLGEGIGGAMSVSSAQLLPVRPRMWALVNISGRLLSEGGRLLAVETGGYRWIRVPPNTDAVRCVGRCVVVAESRTLPDGPLNPVPQAYTALRFERLAPWYLRVSVPPGGKAALRLNELFDSRWQAYIGAHRLTHVRLDTSVNGWLLPARSKATVAVLVEVTALTQAAFELVGILWVLGLFARLARERLSKRCFTSPNEGAPAAISRGI